MVYSGRFEKLVKDHWIPDIMWTIQHNGRKYHISTREIIVTISETYSDADKESFADDLEKLDPWSEWNNYFRNLAKWYVRETWM